MDDRPLRKGDSMRCGIGVLLALIMAGVVGCGTPVGQPAGKVTLKGAPVVNADIAFRGGSDFVGVIGDGGVYSVGYGELKGIPVGTYTVTITRYTQLDGKPLPDGEPGRVLRTSGKVAKKAYQFQKDIAAGPNALDFELTEGKEVAAD